MPQQKVRVIDIPTSATAAEAEQLFNEPYAAGYYLKDIFSQPGAGVRGFFVLYKINPATGKPVGPPANADGREEEALQIIRDNPTLSVRELVLKMNEAGVERGKTWVDNKRYEMRHNGRSKKAARVLTPSGCDALEANSVQARAITARLNSH